MGILPGCKDPTLTAIQSKGYNVVRLPRVDMAPTQLLVSRDKKLQRLGDLLSVFVPSTAPGAPAPPPIKPDMPGPNIGGTKSNQLKLDVGLDILGGLISALGGSAIGVNFAYSRAASVQFEFGSTLESSAEIALIDMFLNSASINPFARAVADMLADDVVYVVTSVLKASTISVAARDEQNRGLGLDIPVIQNAVGANLTVSALTADASVVTYQGAVPLVFGFQAVRLIFDEGRYRTMKLVEAGSIVAEAAQIGDPGAAPADEARLRLEPEWML